MCNLLRSLYLLIRRNQTYVDEMEPFLDTYEEDYFSDEESYNEHLKNNIEKKDLNDGTLINEKVK